MTANGKTSLAASPDMDETHELAEGSSREGPDGSCASAGAAKAIDTMVNAEDRILLNMVVLSLPDVLSERPDRRSGVLDGCEPWSPGRCWRFTDRSNTGPAEHGRVRRIDDVKDGFTYPRVDEVLRVTITPGTPAMVN